jgi:hypothetical protein
MNKYEMTNQRKTEKKKKGEKDRKQMRNRKPWMIPDLGLWTTLSIDL